MDITKYFEKIDTNRFTERTYIQVMGDSYNNVPYICVDIVYDNAEELPYCDVDNVYEAPITNETEKFAESLARELRIHFGIQ